MCSRKVKAFLFNDSIEFGRSSICVFVRPRSYCLPKIRKPIVSLCEEIEMRLLLNWVLSALAVWIVAHLVSGVYVSGWKSALIAALVIGFINATIGLVLKVITFPLTLVTLGLFWLVINALMLELASALLSPGFQVRGFLAAFIGAIVLSLVNLLLKAIVMPKGERH